jgi:hypothetical protein
MWDEFYLLDLGIGIGKKFGMTDDDIIQTDPTPSAGAAGGGAE